MADMTSIACTEVLTTDLEAIYVNMNAGKW